MQRRVLLRSQMMQRLGERERVSKMLSLDALAVPVSCALSFLSVELLLIFTDAEAEPDQLIS